MEAKEQKANPEAESLPKEEEAKSEGENYSSIEEFLLDCCRYGYTHFSIGQRRIKGVEMRKDWTSVSKAKPTLGSLTTTETMSFVPIQVLSFDDRLKWN